MKRILLSLALLLGVGSQIPSMELPPKSTIKTSLLDNNFETLIKLIENNELIESDEFLDMLFNVRVKKIKPYWWVILGHTILTECPLLLGKTKQESQSHEEVKVPTLKDLALKSYIGNYKFDLKRDGVYGTLLQKIGYIKKLEKTEIVTCNKEIHLPYDLSSMTIPTLLSKYGYKAIAEHLQWYCKTFKDYHQYCLGIIDNLPIGSSIKILQILKDSVDRKDILEIHYAVQGKELDFSEKPYSQLIVLLLKSIAMKRFEIARKYVSLCSQKRRFIEEFLNTIQLCLKSLTFQSDEEKKQWMEMPNCMLGILYASRRLDPNQSEADQIECRRIEIKNCCTKITLKELFGFLCDIDEVYHVRTPSVSDEPSCIIS